MLTAAFSLGCEAPTPGPPEPVVRDSAGVRIVSHPPSEGPLLSVAEAPRLRVGLDSADSLTLFGVVGGALLPDGGVLAADAGNYRLIRWSRAGRVLEILGRQGAGPGEFQNISWLQLTDAGVAVYDARTRRISWFELGRGFVKSVRFAVERPDPPSANAVTASGAPFAVLNGSDFVGYAMAYAQPKGQAGPLPLLGDLSVFDSTSARSRPIGTFMLLEWYEDPGNDRFPIANRMETPRLHWSARGALLAISDAVGHRVSIVESGRLETVILESRSRLPFEPDSIPAEYALAADSLQAYRAVLVDGERRIWLESTATSDREPTTWRVFTADGTKLAELQLPPDADVLDASSDRILLLRRSELDEESLEVRDLLAPRS